MPKPRRGYVDTDIGQIHYRRAGPQSGPHLPLVCLHQSPKSSREFERFVTQASDDRDIIALDSPGNGESDLPPETPPVTIQDYARILWQAIDALGIKKIDLFGNHTGAFVAVEMAYQRPERVRHVIMISAFVLSLEEQKQFEHQFQPILLDEEGTRFRHIWSQIQKYGTPGMTLEMKASSFAENLRGGEAYEWGHAAVFAYNQYFPDVVASLSHPITILNPKDLLYDLTPRVEPLLQNGRIIDCPEWGHDVINVFTKDVVETVKSVLARS